MYGLRSHLSMPLSMSPAWSSAVSLPGSVLPGEARGAGASRLCGEGFGFSGVWGGTGAAAEGGSGNCRSTSGRNGGLVFDVSRLWLARRFRWSLSWVGEESGRGPWAGVIPLVLSSLSERSTGSSRVPFPGLAALLLSPYGERYESPGLILVSVPGVVSGVRLDRMLPVGVEIGVEKAEAGELGRRAGEAKGLASES